MTSRTYRTCERIMETVVKAGYVRQIDWWNLRKIIKKIAGGDKRTVEAYRQHLIDFEFVKPYAFRDWKPIVFDINLMKLDYAQTRLNEIVRYEKKVIVQAERNRLSVNGEMKAQK